MWSTSSPPPSASFFTTDPLLSPYLFDSLSLHPRKDHNKNDTFCSTSSTGSRASHCENHNKNDTFCSTSSTGSHASHCESFEDSASTSSTLYSLKVFLGGLPRGTTKVQVLLNFQKYGVVNVEMQGQAGNYCFIIFKSESCCQKFMQRCVSSDGDRLFFPFSVDVFSSRKNMA
uniref:RRM domain-containing protein n=1 Tax=Panagrolaimus sp. PS1159 TaxID=55785 RepID=A0AC35GXN3_9BILA